MNRCDCGKLASFGYVNKTHCNSCKEEDMVNLVFRRKLLCDICRKEAGYGFDKINRCHTHRETGMILHISLYPIDNYDPNPQVRDDETLLPDRYFYNIGLFKTANPSKKKAIVKKLPKGSLKSYLVDLLIESDFKGSFHLSEDVSLMSRIFSKDIIRYKLLNILFEGPIIKSIEPIKGSDTLERLKRVSLQLTKAYVRDFTKRIMNDEPPYTKKETITSFLYRNVSQYYVPVFDGNKVVDILDHDDVLELPDKIQKGWNGKVYNEGQFLRIKDPHFCSPCIYSNTKDNLVLYPLCKKRCDFKYEDLSFRSEDIYQEIFVRSALNLRPNIDQNLLSVYYDSLSRKLYRYLKSVLDIDGAIFNEPLWMEYLSDKAEITTKDSLIIIDSKSKEAFMKLLFHAIMKTHKGGNIQYVKILDIIEGKLIIYDISNMKKGSDKLLLDFIDMLSPERYIVEHKQKRIKKIKKRVKRRVCVDSDEWSFDVTSGEESEEVIFGIYDNPDFDYRKVLKLSFSLGPITFDNINIKVWKKLYGKITLDKDLVEKIELTYNIELGL